MVYDPSGNFIGDHHWLQEGGVQDGDELELDDKGVLVQVCEDVETTQTDLSGLLKRRNRQDNRSNDDKSAGAGRSSGGCGDSLVQDAGRGTAAATPLRPSSVSTSSQLPRSLNDVLGIKKTPIRRATTPKPPYERRYSHSPAVNDNESSDRAPKRQKTSPIRDLEGNSQDTTSCSPAATADTPGRSTPTLSRIPATNASTREQGESRSRSESKNETTPAAPTTPNITATPKDTPSKDAQFQKFSSARNALHSSSRSVPTHVPEKPKNILRLSTEKPRKKLLYQEILARQGQRKGQDSPSTAEIHKNPISNRQL